MEDFYDRQTFDFFVARGDTLNIGLTLYDKNKAAEALTSYGATFKLWNPVTLAYEALLEKTHDDVSGDGIYYFGDTHAWAELNLDATNKLVINIIATDSASLEEGVYPFELILDKDINSVNTKLTILKGQLIIGSRTSGSDFRDVIVDLGQFEI